MIRNLLVVIIIVCSLCMSNSQEIENAKKELMNADIEFSNLSLKTGMNNAFINYIDEYGVLLKPNLMPISGIINVKEFLNRPDTSFTLTWNPLFADISKTFDMGYTYGLFELKIKNENGDIEIRTGNYVTIWKKDKNGKWKFVLDTGNPMK